MKEVLSKENIKLHRMFSLIDDDEYHWDDKDAEEYRIKLRKEYYVHCISVFDHWLSEEEADELIIFYQRKFKFKENKEKYYQYEQLFIKFYLYLFNNTKVYAYFDRLYVSFDSKEEYLSHVLLSIRERLFLKIILPEYHAIIDGGHDLTDLLKVKKDYPEGLEAISKIVKEHGLYILD
ncbi:hypothetical protein [Rickettsia endosymbiont of Orchestes rusci]|uniref:hypothetical protein n=1 Tax=Rickettsia endosymbiont of Orchestes rusci TaxID=3066250 RepID=UPI00313E7F8D